MNRFLLLSLLFAGSAFGAGEEQTYCDFTKEKSEADRLQLESPVLIAGIGRNSTTLSNVMVGGVTESLSHYLKGRLQREIGEGDCELYRSVNDLTKHSTFDSVVIRNNVVARKASFTEDALHQFDDLIAEERQRITVGTSTIVIVELLETSKAKLRNDLFELESQNNPAAVPPLSSTPINQLIVDVSAKLTQQQHLLSNSAKYDTWDVVVGAGGGSEPPTNGDSRKIQPYLSLNFSYSIGSVTRNRALDKSAEAYAKLASEQSTGPIQLALLLKEKVTDMIVFNSKALEAANKYGEAIQSNIESIVGIDTVDAYRFRVQLQIDQINNQIEIHTLQASNQILTHYLVKNFPGGG